MVESREWRRDTWFWKLCNLRKHQVMKLELYSIQGLTENVSIVQFSLLVMSNSSIPWTAAYQASLSITNFWSLLKLMSIVLVMPSNHLILCYPVFLLPSISPSIRILSNESVLHIRWPKYWSFSFSRIFRTDFL